VHVCEDHNSFCLVGAGLEFSHANGGLKSSVLLVNQ